MRRVKNSEYLLATKLDQIEILINKPNRLLGQPNIYEGKHVLRCDFKVNGLNKIIKKMN